MRYVGFVLGRGAPGWGWVQNPAHELRCWPCAWGWALSDGRYGLVCEADTEAEARRVWGVAREVKELEVRTSWEDPVPIWGSR